MGPEQAVALRVSAPATGAAEIWSCLAPVPPFISVKFLDFQAVHTSTVAVLDLLTGGEFFGCSIIKVEHIAKPFEKSTYGYSCEPLSWCCSLCTEPASLACASYRQYENSKMFGASLYVNYLICLKINCQLHKLTVNRSCRAIGTP